MGKPGRPFRKDCGPWDIDVRWPPDDFAGNIPIGDVRLEQFAVLISRNTPKTRAVRTAFPNAAYSSASYRAQRLLSNEGVRRRIAWLRRAVVGATGDPGLGDIQQTASVPDASNAIVVGSSEDQTMFDDSNIPEKRRASPPADLTPAELRLIIARGARDGVPAAIQAAIKMLDAQLAAPEAVADPAGVCAILFNGGGGGETLAVVMERLVQVYGEQAVISAMSHNQSYVASVQSIAQAQGVDAQCITQCGDTGGDGSDSTPAQHGQDQEQGAHGQQAQEDTARQEGPGVGEGGEPASPQDV